MLLFSLACNQTGSKKRIIQSQFDITPCTEAEEALKKITAFSKTGIFSIAKDKIQAAFSADGLEHAISFGKDEGGNIIISAINTGNAHSSTVVAVTNMFADIHNHPKGTPPSSGDLYGFIYMATENTLHEKRFVITAGNDVYAMAIVDPEAARDFVIKYPKVSNPGYQPAFPDSLVNEFNRIRAVYAVKDETAMAFLLKKYNTGVVLLKQADNGIFTCIETGEIGDPVHINNYP